MKTVKGLALIIIVTALLYGAPSVLGRGGHHGGGHRSSVSVHIGYGGGYYYGHGWRPGWGYGYYGWHGYYPHYYYPPVVVAAPVVVQQPVVVRQEVIAPQYSYPAQNANLDGLESVRMIKEQLLGKLNNGQKSDKLQAINDLAGYSFDDTVRGALENVLLSDADADLRKAAANSFGKVKNQGALSALERARIADPDINVRQAADNAINRIKA